MSSQNVLLDSIVRRAKGVLSFDRRTYEEIVRDPGATTEAAIVVAVVAIMSGLGRLADGPGALIGGVISMLLGWVVASAVIYFVGTRVTGDPTTTSSVERVMRVIGYASAPFVFSIFSGIWLIGWFIGIVIFIWYLGTMVFAIRAALSVSLNRAIITGILAWLASVIVNVLISLIFGASLAFPL